MVTNCCVYGCTTRATKGSGISFHVLPKDEDLLKQWLVNINRKDWKPSAQCRICSQHFAAECFDRERFGGRTWLKKDAVPTIFTFSEKKPRRNAKARAKENPQDMPSSSLPLPRNRRCYLGDFTEEDMHSPEKAMKLLQMAIERDREQAKKIQALSRKVKKLKRKVCSLQQIKQVIKKRALISESASNGLEASLSGPAAEVFKSKLLIKSEIKSELESEAESETEEILS